MEFILQLLAQLFAAPAEEHKTDIKEEVMQADKVKTEVTADAAEEQLEPNLFNVLDFH